VFLEKKREFYGLSAAAMRLWKSRLVGEITNRSVVRRQGSSQPIAVIMLRRTARAVLCHDYLKQCLGQLVAQSALQKVRTGFRIKRPLNK
jgi:hypothetical protein